MIRAYGLAAALICYARDAAACLRSLAGNGRPASLDEHFAQVPHDPEPTPLADAAIANLRAMLNDWHDEVWALADVELAEMTREGR